jgi:hypothetical protein
VENQSPARLERDDHVKILFFLLFLLIVVDAAATITFTKTKTNTPSNEESLFFWRMMVHPLYILEDLEMMNGCVSNCASARCCTIAFLFFWNVDSLVLLLFKKYHDVGFLMFLEMYLV